jgi:hypothetical protein
VNEKYREKYCYDLGYISNKMLLKFAYQKQHSENPNTVRLKISSEFLMIMQKSSSRFKILEITLLNYTDSILAVDLYLSPK